MKLLQWRQKVVEVVIEGPKWKCANCEKMYEEAKHTKFEKNEMDFCSMKCITQMR